MVVYVSKIPVLSYNQMIAMKRTILDEYVINKIREIREESGISQESLSYMMNFRSNVVAKAERGDINYNMRHIHLISLALKKAPRDFFPDQPLISEK